MTDREASDATTGSGGRTVVINAALEVKAAITVGVRIGYVSGFDEATTGRERVAAVTSYRGRYMKVWWDLLRARELVAEFYDGQPMTNIVADAAVSLACLSSKALGEHLEAAGYAVRGLVNQDLADAADVANTYKHAGRDANPKDRFGVLLEHVAGSDNYITLAFASSEDLDASTRDARDLIDKVVDRWTWIAERQGFELPPLPGS